MAKIRFLFQLKRRLKKLIFYESAAYEYHSGYSLLAKDRISFDENYYKGQFHKAKAEAYNEILKLIS